MKRLSILLLMSFFTIAIFAQEQKAEHKEIVLEEILVKEKQDVKSNVMTQKVVLGQPRNIGDILTSEAGIGIVKRGGYALEPVLRSFKYEQLNTQIDFGTQVASACANRMDPLTSRVCAEEIRKVELIKGPYSVRFGQSLGGILNIITDKPTASDSLKIAGVLNSGYESNGNSKYARAAFSLVNKSYDFYIGGGIKDFGNYENGDGQEIASEYDNRDYVLKLGINPSKNQRLQFNWRQTFADKILHVGLPMDAKNDMSYVGSADYYIQNIGSKFYAFRAKAYYSYTDHWMTNQWRPISKKVDAETGVNSRVAGGRMEFTLLPTDRTTLYIGADLKMIHRDGTRYRTVKINPCTNVELAMPMEFEDLVWQDSNNENLGFFAESRMRINERLLVVAGARLDYQHSSINNAAADFAETYGDDLQPDDELNFSLNATANYTFGNDYSLQFSVGRGTRAPSLLERYINHLTVGQDAHEYVGNPNLKSEVNYQTDLSLAKAGENYRVYANIFYSHLENYITAAVDENLPRKYMPCKDPKFAKRFLNSDAAYQTGFEIGASVKFAKYWSVDANAAYTYAQNKTWDEPLPEVPPLALNLSAKFETKQFTAILKGRVTAQQDRVSESFSETETPAYEVFDLNLEYRPIRYVSLRAGVNNILNRNYYDHLSRPYKSMSEQSMFYEPGRNFTLGLQLKF